ncbi:MAG: glycosyltransferase [Anaerolineae bacterium]|nr:glycosyltransferase [Anaerolineae bacterium]
MAQKKKLVILTADAGFGHRIAANAVQAAVKEKYGDQLDAPIINLLDSPQTPKILRDSQNDYDKLVRRAPELYQIGYEASDDSITTAIGEGALSVALFNATAQMIETHQPDAILSTYPLYSAALHSVFESKGIRIPTLLVITDLVTVHQIWYNRHIDTCLVPTEQVAAQAEKAGIPRSRIHLTGIPVNPQLSQIPDNRTILRKALGWKMNRTTFLAVGSKRVKQLLPVLNVINHYGGRLQLAVVCGRDEALYQELQQMEWHIPVFLYQFVENMAPLLHAADAIICKAGGLITTEALACGLPMLIVEAIPGQEEGNARYVTENGAGAFVQTPLAALEVVHHWLMKNRKRLKRIREKATALGHAEAAYTIADLCWQAVCEGPRTAPTAARQAMEKVRSNVQQLGGDILSDLGLWDHEQFQLFLDDLEATLKEQLLHHKSSKTNPKGETK